MKKMFVLVAMLALSSAAFANGGGEGNNTHCNGVGNHNSPCVPSTPPGNGGGNGGNGGAGGAGGDATAVGTGIGVGVGIANAESNAAAVAVISVGNGGSLGTPESLNAGTQSTDGTGVTIAGNATAPFSNANYVENNSQVGDVTSGDVTSTNTNNNTAMGGEGGDATATATIAEGAVVIERGAFEAPAYSSSYSYTEQRQAPAVGQGSFAISGCSVGGNAGGSNIHGSAFLGFGWTPQECYKFMLAQAYQSIGEKKAVCDILRNTKVGRRLEKDGVVLPECVEQVVIVATPVAPQVDLTPYATKEEVNEKVDRAFRASQEK